MNQRTIRELINGTIITGGSTQECLIEYAFASDLMSDVLTINSENLLLITGLVNIQAIRTAEMSDIGCIIFVRNKQVSPEMIRLAEESKITIIQSPYSMFRTSGLLFSAGVKPVF